MDNFQDLMNYVLPWAKQNSEPVADITFRCFMHIQNNAGLLSRYNTLLAAKGATPQVRQTVNEQIAKEIEFALNLQSDGKVELPKGEFLINSYSRLKEKTI